MNDAENAPLKQVVVACEDFKTAPNYFEEMDQRCRTNVKILVARRDDADCGNSAPDHVVDQLDQYKEELERDFNSTDVSVDYWAVIDRDKQSWTTECIESAIARCAESGYNIAISNPFFEVWIAMHVPDEFAKLLNSITDQSSHPELAKIKHIYGALKAKHHGRHVEIYDELFAECTAAISLSKTRETPPGYIPAIMSTQVHFLAELFIPSLAN